MASDILTKAYEINPEDAKMLIIKEIPEIGNATCLQIASISEQQYFISNKCCQELLIRIWFHKLSPDTPKIFVKNKKKFQKKKSNPKTLSFYYKDRFITYMSSIGAIFMQYKTKLEMVQN